MPLKLNNQHAVCYLFTKEDILLFAGGFCCVTWPTIISQQSAHRLLPLKPQTVISTFLFECSLNSVDKTR